MIKRTGPLRRAFLGPIDTTVIPSHERKDIALLATCQQIHDEAIEIFYSENTFVLPPVIQELEKCFRTQPASSFMQYLYLVSSLGSNPDRDRWRQIGATEASVRLIVDSCPALKVIKVYVQLWFAQEAGRKWRLLDVSANRLWHCFQAFPHEGNAAKLNSGENG